MEYPVSSVKLLLIILILYFQEVKADGDVYLLQERWVWKTLPKFLPKIASIAQ